MISSFLGKRGPPLAGEPVVELGGHVDGELVAQLGVDHGLDQLEVELALDHVRGVEQTGHRGQHALAADVVEGRRRDDHVAVLKLLVFIDLGQRRREDDLLVLA